jgi:hypothetical protein
MNVLALLDKMKVRIWKFKYTLKSVPPSSAYFLCHLHFQEQIARGGLGIPRVSLGPTMPDPSTPGGWATPETPYGLTFLKTES